MRYLYIDTSSSYLYTGIVANDEIVAEIKEEYGQSLSEVALPRIASMFEKNNLKASDIDKIVVVNGPGSFTGIRIGLTIAKVYAWSLNIPITMINALEVMAVSSTNSCIHIPMINARRGYVFAAIYDEKLNELLKPQHIELKKLKEKIKQYNDYEIITNDEFEDIDIKSAYTPDIVKIISKFKDKKAVNPHAVNPNYLKLTEAEENKL